MPWLKNIILDLVVTALILIAVITDAAWARWAVIVYTPIMLLFKIFAVIGGTLARQFTSSESAAPPWVFHALYAVNVVAPMLVQWWLIAAGWALIWLLSAIQERQAAR